MKLKIADGTFKGKTISGIYKFDGDSLILCQTDIRSTTTPEAFVSKKGTYHVLMRLARDAN